MTKIRGAPPGILSNQDVAGRMDRNALPLRFQTQLRRFALGGRGRGLGLLHRGGQGLAGEHHVDLFSIFLARC